MNLKGKGPGMAKTSNDGINAKGHGKGYGSATEGMSKSIAAGGLNYNANECASAIKGGKK